MNEQIKKNREKIIAKLMRKILKLVTIEYQEKNIPITKEEGIQYYGTAVFGYMYSKEKDKYIKICNLKVRGDCKDEYKDLFYETRFWAGEFNPNKK